MHRSSVYKTFLALAGIFCLFAASAHDLRAECDKQSASVKYRDGFMLRQTVMGNFNIDLEVFQKLLEPADELIAELESELWELDENDRRWARTEQKYCRAVDSYLKQADDVLAGGDGKGERNPWNKFTPEDLNEAYKEYQDACFDNPELCNPDSQLVHEVNTRCNELLNQVWPKEISGPEFIDAYTENFLQAIERLNAQTK